MYGGKGGIGMLGSVSGAGVAVAVDDLYKYTY